jgi:hypothetical protein
VLKLARAEAGPAVRPLEDEVFLTAGKLVLVVLGTYGCRCLPLLVYNLVGPLTFSRLEVRVCVDCVHGREDPRCRVDGVVADRHEERGESEEAGWLCQ